LSLVPPGSYTSSSDIPAPRSATGAGSPPFQRSQPLFSLRPIRRQEQGSDQVKPDDDTHSKQRTPGTAAYERAKKNTDKEGIDWLATEQWCPRPVTAAPTTEDDIAVPTHCISPRPRSGASHCPRTTRGHSPWRTSWTLTRRLRESALPSQ
jgi:hypothetical protein